MNLSKYETRYLSGFTMIEVTVALLLSSVVIVMIYYVLTMSEKGLVNFKGSNLNLEKIAQFNEIMSKDFEASVIVYKEDSEFNFKRDDSSNIKYMIKPDCIVRVFDGFHDSFPIKVKEIHTFMFLNEITERSHKIDELKFLDDKGIMFDYAKTYTSDQLIRLDSTTNLN